MTEKVDRMRFYSIDNEALDMYIRQKEFIENAVYILEILHEEFDDERIADMLRRGSFPDDISLDDVLEEGVKIINERNK